jgi:hypothetical protein
MLADFGISSVKTLMTANDCLWCSEKTGRAKRN